MIIGGIIYYSVVFCSFMSTWTRFLNYIYGLDLKKTLHQIEVHIAARIDKPHFHVSCTYVFKDYKNA